MKLIIVLLTAVVFISGCETTKSTTENKKKKFDIKIEPTVFDKKFPALFVHIDYDGKYQGKQYVRFPEVIEAWSTKNKKLVRFYQDNRLPEWPVDLPCEPLKLPVDWKGNDKERSFTMKLSNGMVLNSKAKVVGNKVLFSHKLFNDTNLELKKIKMWTCVQNINVENIADTRMERTSTPVNNKFQLFRKLIPACVPFEEAEKIVNQIFIAYSDASKKFYKENPFIARHPGHPNDNKEAIYFWQVEKSISKPAIATVSKNGKWGVAVVSKDAVNVMANPAISCQHSDPTVPLCKPGETAEIKNKMIFFEGQPNL